MNNTNPIRPLVRGFYDLQHLRIQSGQRIVATFKHKLGIRPGEKEDKELDAEGKKILKDLRDSYKLLTEGVVVKAKNFKGEGLISSFSEFSLVAQYLSLEEAEKEQLSRIDKIVQEHPLWENFLKDVKGVGPTLAAVILSEIDITKCTYPSSLYRYAGLDCGPDGKATSRKKEHLIDVEYIDKEGNKQTKKSITYNPFLRSKLIGVLGSSFLRAGDNYFRTIYDNYKHRLEHRPDLKEHTKAHKHAMAIRYMVKIFMFYLYLAWRDLEKLPMYALYEDDKLRLPHQGEWYFKPEGEILKTSAGRDK